MGDIIKTNHDDMEHYVWLCQKYGEEVQKTETAQGVKLPDCYGEHVQKLKARIKEERQRELEQ